MFLFNSLKLLVYLFLHLLKELPCGPVVKNPPCNAGVVGLIPGQEMKMPCTMEQISPHTPATEAMCSGAPTSQLESALQEKTLHDTTEIPQAATKAQHSQVNRKTCSRKPVVKDGFLSGLPVKNLPANAGDAG